METQFQSLLGILDGVYFANEDMDRQMRVMMTKGVSSVYSFHSLLVSIRKFKAPCVFAFRWLAFLRVILTVNNLWRRKIVIVNVCPLVSQNWNTLTILY